MMLCLCSCATAAAARATSLLGLEAQRQVWEMGDRELLFFDMSCQSAFHRLPIKGPPFDHRLRDGTALCVFFLHLQWFVRQRAYYNF